MFTPFILFGVLALAAVSAFLPISERRVRDLGVIFMLVASGLGVWIAWPGLFESKVFGPADLWYLDGVSALILGLIAVISFMSMAVAHRYLAKEYKDGLVSVTDIRHYYAMVPVFVAFMYVVTLSNNLALMWIALEASTLSTTLLIAFYRKRSAIEAAWKYVLLCSLGISLGLVGILLTIYAAGQSGVTSSLLLSSFRQIAGSGGMNIQLIRWAFVFIFIGIGTKVGFAPMHAWLPDAHSKTPAPVSVLLSGVLLNVALLSLLRFRQVTDLALGDGGAWSGKFFLVFGCLSIVIPALIMITQKNYQRLLAYSSIKHMGLVAFAIGLGPAGLIPALMHIPAHALLKSSLFVGAGEIFISYRSTDSGSIGDTWNKLPKTSALFLVSTLLLLGIPLSPIFVSQMLISGLGLQAFLAPTLLVVVALTVVFVAVLRHLHTLLFGNVTTIDAKARVKEAWKITHMIMLVHIILVIALGIAYLTPMGLNFMVNMAAALNTELL